METQAPTPKLIPLAMEFLRRQLPTTSEYLAQFSDFLFMDAIARGHAIFSREWHTNHQEEEPIFWAMTKLMQQKYIPEGYAGGKLACTNMFIFTRQDTPDGELTDLVFVEFARSSMQLRDFHYRAEICISGIPASVDRVLKVLHEFEKQVRAEMGDLVAKARDKLPDTGIHSEEERVMNNERRSQLNREKTKLTLDAANFNPASFREWGTVDWAVFACVAVVIDAGILFGFGFSMASLIAMLLGTSIFPLVRSMLAKRWTANYQKYITGQLMIKNIDDELERRPL